MSVSIRLWISYTDDGFRHLQAETDGDTKEEALSAAEGVLQLYAAGKEAFIRVKPEVNSEQDFDTKQFHHRGYVRFSFRDIPGSWKYRKDYPDSEIYFGIAKEEVVA